MTLLSLLLLLPLGLAADAADATAADTAAEPEADATPEGRTFGASLNQLSVDVLGLQVSWSGYGDVQASADAEGHFSFDSYHFNPILSAQAGDKARAEVEFEVEHAGEEIKMEYAVFDYTPNPHLTVRAGKLLIPIGEYNDVLHPSFRWTQASRPAFLGTVVPGVWSDVGVSMMGDIGAVGAKVADWQVYAVNGLATNSTDVNDPKYIRNARDNYVDNNTDKGVGGRFRVYARRGQPVGDTTLALSG